MRQKKFDYMYTSTANFTLGVFVFYYCSKNQINVMLLIFILI